MNKYQKYKKASEQASVEAESEKDYMPFESNSSNGLFLSLDWELLEEDKVEQLRFLIQTEELI